MTQTKIITRKRDLSHINNLEDLKAEISKVEAGLKEKELDLETRWQKLPSEVVKTTLGAAIPFFLNNAVANKTWGLVRNAGSLLFAGSSAKGDLKRTLINSAKQVGLFTALKGFYNFWRKKK